MTNQTVRAAIYSTATGHSLHMIAISSRGNGSECAIYRRTGSSRQSALALAADELLDAAICFVVGHLNRRMLRKIGRRGMQHTADAAIERKLAAADGVDRYAGGVWRIFDRKFHIDFHRHIAEEPAFYANKGNLVIELPGHVITRPNVDIFVRQALADHRLDRFGFRSFLGRQPSAIEHVEEIGVAAGVQLISADKLHAALAKKVNQSPMHDRSAHLRFDVIPYDRQILIGKSPCPLWIAGDEHGDVIDEAKPGLQRATGIKTGRLFGARPAR